MHSGNPLIANAGVVEKFFIFIDQTEFSIVLFISEPIVMRLDRMLRNAHRKVWNFSRMSDTKGGIPAFLFYKRRVRRVASGEEERERGRGGEGRDNRVSGKFAVISTRKERVFSLKRTSSPGFILKAISLSRTDKESSKSEETNAG